MAKIACKITPNKIGDQVVNVICSTVKALAFVGLIIAWVTKRVCEHVYIDQPHLIDTLYVLTHIFLWVWMILMIISIIGRIDLTYEWNRR